MWCLFACFSYATGGRLLLRKGFLLECELCFPEGIMVLVLSVLSELC